MQTTVRESGPEWVPRSPPIVPPSLPCEGGPAGRRQAQRLCPSSTAPAWRFPVLVSAALIKGVRGGKYHHHQSSSSYTQCDINKKINNVCPIFPPIPFLL